MEDSPVDSVVPVLEDRNEGVDEEEVDEDKEMVVDEDKEMAVEVDEDDSPPVAPAVEEGG